MKIYAICSREVLKQIIFLILLPVQLAERNFEDVFYLCFYFIFF